MGFRYLIALIFYTLCFEIISTNSRTSTLWKLNEDQTKIVEGSPFQQVTSYPSQNNRAQFVADDDPIFSIITSTVHVGETWIKNHNDHYCTNCHMAKNLNAEKTVKNQSEDNVGVTEGGTRTDADEVLDCGKPVNFTYYDNLVGVLNRDRHPNVPEPQAAIIFSKKNRNKNSVQDFDVDAMERRLKKAKREKPKSVQLYNQIGNFWRVKGDAEKAIECFRRALAVSPHNAEVLLNLARILFTLQYLDDAIYLTRRSLEMQPPDKGAWQQYFTLGQILKAYGHYQEAIVHLKHSLELKPGFEPAELALKELATIPVEGLHAYTMLIIICLVLVVLLVILSHVEPVREEFQEAKMQRHFNKAMAMKSIRGLGIPPKHPRSKKVLT